MKLETLEKRMRRGLESQRFGRYGWITALIAMSGSALSIAAKNGVSWKAALAVLIGLGFAATIVERWRNSRELIDVYGGRLIELLDSTYHAILFTNREEAAAFVAALGRQLHSPRRDLADGPASYEEDVEIAATTSADGTTLYLSDGAMKAFTTAFATPPATTTLLGKELPADRVAILIGAPDAPIGIEDVMRSLNRMLKPAIVVALSAVAHSATAQALKPLAERDFTNVRAVFSGARALETVAYLDKFVRWPGNPGFDSSIAHVAARLRAAGYVEQDKAKPTDRLTYRVEKYSMTGAAWDPHDASLEFVGRTGAPILSFATNRNMLATNSYSTPPEGVDAEVVRVASATPAALDSAGVAGKIVMADGGIGRVFTEAVVRRGAIGVLAYSMPAYTQPEKNTHSIQFSGIGNDSSKKSFGILLSFDARRQLLEALKEGPVRVRVNVRSTMIRPATELALVADVRGSATPDQRFVYSAHVQEPGANDDASGVGTLTEMARTLAELVKSKRADPKRTITMLWGQEIRVTDRYLKQDTARLKGVRWGVSLDMVGEDTKKTGGTFLIEKMPDPSAIWTRGDDKHTEWGGSVLAESAMKPHWFNDYLLARCNQQSKSNGWVVNSNPFEGGSDHTAYLNNGVPGVLFWHFTDQFYHTDGDRIDMVSSTTLANVGACALVSGLVLASADGGTARAIIAEAQAAAFKRLDAEAALSKTAIAAGGDAAKEKHILETWATWYDSAIRKATDIETGAPSPKVTEAIDAATKAVAQRLTTLLKAL